MNGILESNDMLGAESLLSPSLMAIGADVEAPWDESLDIPVIPLDGVEDIDAWARKTLAAGGFGGAAMDYD